MSQEKKYDYRVIKQDKTWTAEITRRVSSKKTTVSKSETGFKLKREATAWGKTELEAFVKNLSARNTRQGEQRVVKADLYEKRVLKFAELKKKKDEEKALRQTTELESSSLIEEDEGDNLSIEDFDDWKED